MRNSCSVFILINILLFSSCEKEKLNPGECLLAKVIGPQFCTSGGSNNLYLIQILGVEKFGNKIKYYDGIEYQNVVEISNLHQDKTNKGTLINFQYENNEPPHFNVCDRMNFIFDVPQISIKNFCEIRD